LSEKEYAKLLAEYARQFGDQPPSILSENGAAELMTAALHRGTPIVREDMTGSPTQSPRRNVVRHRAAG